MGDLKAINEIFVFTGKEKVLLFSEFIIWPTIGGAKIILSVCKNILILFNIWSR